MVVIIGLSGILAAITWLFILAACMRSAQISRMEEIRLEAKYYSDQ
jgi:hypothetical protein